MRYDAIIDNSSHLISLEQRNLHYDLHFHNALEFNYVIKGAGLRVTVFNQTEIFESGDLSLVSGLIPHSIETIGETLAGNLIIPMHYIANFFAQTNGFVRYASLKNKQVNEKIFVIINEIKNLISTPYIELQHAYVNVLLLTILKDYPESSSHLNKDINLCIGIIEYIQENFKKNDLSISDVANAFGYNKNYFSKLFNETFSCNFKTYLNRIRLHYIKTQLREQPQRKLLSLILDAGFNDTSTYYRTVKANSVDCYPPPENLILSSCTLFAFLI